MINPTRRSILLAGVLLLAAAPLRMLRAQDQDIVEILNAGNYKTLVRALTEANLLQTLKGPGPFTLFAPTDDAFAKLPAERLNALMKDKSALKQLLLYHVVAGRVMAADIARLDGKGAKTMEMSEAKVMMMGSTIMINNAHVSRADIPAKNGVVHEIDAVIMPPGR